MDYEFYAKRLQCSHEEKLQCLDTVKKLYRYARAARMQGLLALESAVETERNLFLRNGLMMVVDSHVPEKIHDALLAAVLADNFHGGPFLEQILVMEGVRLIQEGVNPASLLDYLSGWFGSGFQREYREAAYHLAREAARSHTPPVPEAPPPHSALPRFDVLEQADDMSVQRILRDIRLSDLACAISGASGPVRDKLLNNLSLRTRGLLADELAGHMPVPAEYAALAQRQFLDTARRLEEEGEIILFWGRRIYSEGAGRMKLEVFFDYLCEFCYEGHHGYLMELLPRYPHIEPVWRPCEAHPRLTEPEGRHSDLAIQGMFFVQDQGGDAGVYHDCVYNAVYRQGQNIEDPDVLARCALAAGVAAEGFREALENRAYEKRQMDANVYAYETMEVKAVPTFVLANGSRLDSFLGYGVRREQLKRLLDSVSGEPVP